MKSYFPSLLHWLTGQARRRWLPPALALFLLTAAAGALGWQALQERDRAERTVETLSHDYAAFVSQRLRQESSDHYRSCSGLRTSGQAPQESASQTTPFSHLRSWAVGSEPDSSHGPNWVRYYFRFQASSGSLQTRGAESPTLMEEEQLREAINGIRHCAPNQTLTWPSLDAPQNTQGRLPSWGVLLQTDSLGGIREVYGFAVSQPLLADHLMARLLSPQSECGCSRLLPESLSGIENIGAAASVVVRDASGEVALSSGPIPAGISTSSLVRTPLGEELPFPGWTVEVAIRPQVIKGLFPSAGLPIWALALLGTVVAAAALLGARSLRRSEELLRLQENFVSNVSHELKTPLSKIRLFNELLDPSRGEHQKASRYRGVIDRECRRLSLLVDNVLRLAEPGSGASGHRLERLSMRQVAERALETFRAANDPQRGRFVLECADHAVVEGDEALLQQVVMNLLDNAVKYSPAGTPIALRVKKGEEGVRIEVEDSGPGIPVSQQRLIFEKFYRIEGGDDQGTAGSGLGLALVRRHVQFHRGSVRVMTGAQGGSLFIVELPAARARAGEGSGLDEGQALNPAGSSV